MDSQKKLVSIVTASYNMGQYLPLTVNSALEQTYPNIEIHVVDDGSTDGTREIMNRFRNDRRVHYHYQSNQGQAKAKNKGIRESKGDFIAFLDADDLWYHDKLEKQLPLFGSSDKIGVVYSDQTLIDEQGNILAASWRKKYYSGNITERLFIKNFINFNSTVVKRECFDSVGLFDESLSMSIDWDLWLRISTKYEFAYLDDPTFHYRTWPGQMSHNHSKRFACAIKVMNNFLRQYPELLSKDTVSEAWADTYTGLGHILNKSEKKRSKALKYYIYALKVRPKYLPAWKGIVEVLIR